MSVDRKHGLRITDYGLMSCDTAGHHVTLILLWWLGIRNGETGNEETHIVIEP